MQIQIDEARLIGELKTLAGFTNVEPSTEGTAVTRVVFTEDDLRARAWLKQRAADAGFAIREDAVGNSFFRWTGLEPQLPAVGTGSHIDAIPHAGMYDGTVGVLGGLEAMRALKESGFQPRRSIELLLFTSEEPTRFGIGCLGSRLLSGTLAPEHADALTDSNDETLAHVRAAAGFSGTLATVPLPANFYHAWVELHIEQGPLLEREGLPLGIVTSIAAPAGYRFTITGFGGHAGALLMPDRKDALCAAAEMILSIERHALAANAAAGSIDTVATVGTCDVHPGAVNSVPSRVVLQLDIRDTDPNRRESVMQAVRRDYEELRQRRGVTIIEELVNADAPAQSSAQIINVLERACAEHGITPKKMVSRAYHDSLFMARVAPIAMLFIPCRNGVSHRPDEFSTDADIVRGTGVLAAALAHLASE
ncbi:M20 family metallo-hydrolase [Granulicella arctica]|uniref:N-carbamoyl-L-amino-acid hydrolase n=1 Tax=Granulicella arctica TaxID=940613 RepID=A0A7Y9PGP3_9BACT|nr:M20 family metallo-hydrolase [Granulicella arctica]NYF79409.1 N-carbamoyl-L-amino-acid hydrolase [Granulicella arctica]